MNFLKKIYTFIKDPNENYPNTLILRYHLLKAYEKIKNRDKNDHKKDMFNWKLYTLHYRGEMKKIKKMYTIDLNEGDYTFINNILVKTKKGIKPLHENSRLLFETIMQLNPSSIFEMGCGNGVLLNGIQTLSPAIKLSAIDLSNEQIKYLRETYPDLKAEIEQYDATTQFPDNLIQKSELSFTQAVLQHIHEYDKHLIALANLFNSSQKHIILIERWKNHQFMDDILNLQKEGKINWDKINFYYKISEEDGRPRIMICSKEILDYPILDDYNKINFEINK